MFIARLTAFFPSLNLRSVRFLARVIQVARQRRHLARLDDEGLFDLGLTREEVIAECNRSMWDIADSGRA